jgi:hypothetical protein
MPSGIGLFLLLNYICFDRLCQRERQEEGRSLIFYRLKPDMAAKPLDDFATEVQS